MLRRHRVEALRSCCAIVLIGCSSLSASAPLAAQEPGNDPIHWAYAAFYGIGRYSIDGAQDAYAFGLSPSRERRAAELTDDGRRIPGITLRFPFSIGTYDFDIDNLGTDLSVDDVSFTSFVPGVEIEVPISHRWRLRPLAHLGWGRQAGGGPSAWIYAIGLKSQLEFPQTRAGLRLVNSLTYIGYSSSDTRSSGAGNTLPMLTGLEFQRPLRNTRIHGAPVSMLWHVAYTNYLNELGFDDAAPLGATTEVDNVWEIGVGFSRGDEPLSLWKFSLDEVRLVLKAESDGHFSGVSVTFSSLFDR